MVDSELDLVIDITLHLSKLRLICQVLAQYRATGRIRVYCSWFWVVLVGFVGFVGGFGWFWLVLLVVLGRFGWFWLVPCFRNYEYYIACASDHEFFVHRDCRNV